jgi:hypothetical protein
VKYADRDDNQCRNEWHEKSGKTVCHAPATLPPLPRLRIKRPRC